MLFYLPVNGNRFASKICLRRVGSVIQHVVEGMPRGIVFRVQSCDLLSRGWNRGQPLKRFLRQELYQAIENRTKKT